MRLDDLSSCHPNILKGVIVGKKSWGLFLTEWTDGVVSGEFSEREILNEFTNRNIKIPEPLMIDWDNVIIKKIKKKIEDGNN